MTHVPAAPHGARLPQPLLFRQIVLLEAIAGVLAYRLPVAGLAAGMLLLFLAMPRGYLRSLPLPVAAFALGALLAWGTAHEPPAGDAIPPWVRAASTPAGEHTDPRFGSGVPVTGAVREVTYLPGNRVRLLLEGVRTGETHDAPMPGLLVLTWRNPPPVLAAAGPGQNIAATLRIREIRGFANPGTWEIESYWRDRGAFFRAWASDDGSRNGKNAAVTVSGKPPRAWALRERLRGRVIAAISDASTGIAAPRSPDSVPGLAAPPAVSPAAAFLPALLFGDRSLCPPEVLDLVARATLAHSLALSGMHLGFAAAAGYAAAYLLSFLFPGLFLRLPRQKAGLLLAAPACLCYLWLGGAPPSLARAALMLFFWGWLLWRNRPRVLVDGLVWAVAVIVALNPAVVYDIRLQLSAVSVAGIALATPFLERLALAAATPGRAAGALAAVPAGSTFGRLMAAARGPLLLLAGMAGVSLAAQIAILPLVLNAFPGLGLWFPLNLVWLPVLGAWVMPLAFGGLFFAFLSLVSGGFLAEILLTAASALFSLAEIPCTALVGLLRSMDGLGILASPVALRPAWPAWAGFWLLLLLIPSLYKARSFTRRTAALAVTGMILLTGPSLYAAMDRGDTVRLTLIDVGQGQSALISWRENGREGRILVDGGGYGASIFDIGRQVVAPVLTANKPPDLDLVVNTHPDADHLQGLLFPLASFRVGAFARGPETGLRVTKTMERRDLVLRRRNLPPRIVRAGDVLPLSDTLSLEVLHPSPAMAAKLSANDSALVLRLVRRGTPLALVCGDVEKRGIAGLLASGRDLHAEVLVLPHHGSSGSFSPALYKAVRPALALAACGYANTWHFPSARVRDELEKLDIPLATTADRGQVVVEWRDHTPMRVSFAR